MIIDDIVEKTKIRIEKEKTEISLEQIKSQALQIPRNSRPSFHQALSQKGLAYILEVKKASPSKGEISKDFNYIQIAKEYEEIGADAISVLTEPDFFKGSLSYLSQISQEVSLPLLRKDFIIDEYMIYQAKVAGASAVLLIASILDEKTLKYYRELAESLGMEALIEARDEEQVMKAIKAGARIIGVNNRDLRDFSVDIHHSLRFKKMIPENIVFVSESGIYSRAQTQELEEHQVNAVLIGETMMKSPEKKKRLEELKGIEHEN